MQRSPKKVKDRDIQYNFDFVFQNAMGMPIIFDSEPTVSQMKANTWGKVSGDNTALYIRFADGGGIKITGTEMT